MTGARCGGGYRAAPCDVDWTVDMSACDAHDLLMAPHNFLHGPTAMQPSRIHPLHTGPKRRVMHENQRRRVGLRAEGIIRPSQPLLTNHPMVVFRHRAIESNKAERESVDRIVHERR